ncbi:hypothetical protein [Bosea sp. 685]|uniref:hypothetical protein n=1 Tax=Bosea sp. 685 TaxID=3080057 RepID=UPI0028934728|nr:hypothetical protein [Bosea sp. 685]WNJ92540.1 hypothetical protein RMR04_09665 [Bosea sp. 685]
MDLGNTPRVTGVAGVNIIPRSDVVAAKGSVTVDLPPEQTVQSAGEAVRIEIRTQDRKTQTSADRSAANRQSEQASRDVIESHLYIEPLTRSLVLQKKNMQTGETTEQVPDEATLKLRVYNRQLAELAREASEVAAHTVERTA